MTVLYQLRLGTSCVDETLWFTHPFPAGRGVFEIAVAQAFTTALATSPSGEDSFAAIRPQVLAELEEHGFTLAPAPAIHCVEVPTGGLRRLARHRERLDQLRHLPRHAHSFSARLHQFLAAQGLLRPDPPAAPTQSVVIRLPKKRQGQLV